MPNQYFATNRKVGDGSTTVWEFSFAGARPDANNGTAPYLAAEDVGVALVSYDAEGREQRTPVSFTLLGPSQVEVVPAIAAGQDFVIFRETESNLPVSDFTDFASISEQDLDNSFRQALFVVQEAQDYNRDTREIARVSRVLATNAVGDASAALSASTTAVSTANTAVSTANTAASVASTALDTADTANSNASTALSQSSTALDNSAQVTGFQAQLDAIEQRVEDLTGVDPTALALNSDNLANLADFDQARLNLNVYSKPEVDSALVDVADTAAAALQDHTANDNPHPQYGAKPIRIVALGDSLTAQNALTDVAWPGVLERNLRQIGANVEVVNLGVNAHSFYRALNTVTVGGQTAVERTVGLSPDLVLVALGFNDAVSAVDGRTPAQIEADGIAALQALRPGLPYAHIVLVRTVVYDRVHGTLGSLVNRQVIPDRMALPTSGVYANAYAPSVLSSTISSTNQTKFSALDNLLDALSVQNTIDGTFTIDFWRVARLGGTSTDGLHPSSFGSVLQAGYVLEGIKSAPYLTYLSSLLNEQNKTEWTNPDGLFSALLTSSGGQYVATEGRSGEHLTRTYGNAQATDPENWYRPSKGSAHLVSGSLVQPSKAVFAIQGADSNNVVQISTGGRYTSTSVTTNWRGDALLEIDAQWTGTRTYYIKVKDDVFGPFRVSMAVPTPPAPKTDQYLHAFRTSTTPLANNAFVVVPFTSVGLNTITSGTFSTSTYRFTITEKCAIQIEAAVHLGAGAGTIANLSVFVNGSVNQRLFQNHTAAQGTNFLRGVTVLGLQPGDYFDIRVFATGSTASISNVSKENTYLRIVRLT